MGKNNEISAKDMLSENFGSYDRIAYEFDLCTGQKNVQAGNPAFFRDGQLSESGKKSRVSLFSPVHRNLIYEEISGQTWLSEIPVPGLTVLSSLKMRNMTVS